MLIQVPYNYPIAAPKVRFLNKVCHPNVNIKVGAFSSPRWLARRRSLTTARSTYAPAAEPAPPQTGEICVDVLAARWSPAWTLESICLAIQVLLSEPDESSPLNCDAGNLLRCKDMRGYRSLVRMYTELYAMDAPPLATSSR